VDHTKLTQRINSLMAAVESYNADNPHLPIHFAVGVALSSEYSNISRIDLFRKADENMYRNKQIWYEQKRASV